MLIAMLFAEAAFNYSSVQVTTQVLVWQGRAGRHGAALPNRHAAVVPQSAETTPDRATQSWTICVLSAWRLAKLSAAPIRQGALGQICDVLALRH
jgi:hypothetical protein